MCFLLALTVGHLLLGFFALSTPTVVLSCEQVFSILFSSFLSLSAFWVCPILVILFLFLLVFFFVPSYLDFHCYNLETHFNTAQCLCNLCCYSSCCQAKPIVSSSWLRLAFFPAFPHPPSDPASHPARKVLPSQAECCSSAISLLGIISMLCWALKKS